MVSIPLAALEIDGSGKRRNLVGYLGLQREFVDFSDQSNELARQAGDGRLRTKKKNWAIDWI